MVCQKWLPMCSNFSHWWSRLHMWHLFLQPIAVWFKIYWCCNKIYLNQKDVPNVPKVATYTATLLVEWNDVQRQSYQFQKDHINFKKITLISKRLHRFQKDHMDFKKITWISKRSHRFQKDHIHFKKITSISKRSHQFQKDHILLLSEVPQTPRLLSRTPRTPTTPTTPRPGPQGRHQGL